MSYVALARKWRPRRFSEMIGQEHVRRALTNALDADRVHHAFLFTGTRGVGKTTIARILAKCLNCERGVSAEPCGECASCREIDGGRFVDLIEVDAASRTKVDDTRELLDNVQYAPTRGRYKVYLIDEVHMLSTSSFNALLKTLEEPPPHVKFLLATTDPQKLPPTVLSRCLQFNLKRMPLTLLNERMKQILEGEGIGFEPAAVRLIAQAADGSVRDALSLLDQLLAFGGGRVTEADARAMLGTVARDHVVGVVRQLAGADPAALLRCVQQLEEFSPDYAQLLDELAGLLTRVALKQVVSDYAGDELYAPELIEQLAREMAPEDVQLYYQIAILGRRDLPLAPDPRTGFEMTLLRMAAFRPASAERGVQRERPGTREPPAAPSARGQPSAAPAVAGPIPEPAVAVGTDASAPAPGNVPGSEAWRAILGQLDLAGAARQLANHCALLGRQGAVVRLGLDPRNAAVRTRALEEKLAQALSRHYGEPVRLEFVIAEVPLETPAQAEQRASLAELEAARQALATDPTVRVLQERFGATLLPDSVRPSK
ncbi:MAG TPA: DNA polymerase III subunit gamma/tau [Steroidobacteraceae bacterium]|nr:DNA polymerase III subunit gamma/tau [Steroidobacteraceae bacterium]